MKTTKKLMWMLGMAFAVLLIGCNDEVSQTPQTEAPVQEAVINDGVQTATLSWGRINYQPEVLKFKKGVPAVIKADTQRLTGCYRVLIIPQLKLEKHFSEKDNELEFTPTQSGTYPFGCAMGMGRGTIIIE